MKQYNTLRNAAIVAQAVGVFAFGIGVVSWGISIIPDSELESWGWWIILVGIPGGVFTMSVSSIILLLIDIALNTQLSAIAQSDMAAMLKKRASKNKSTSEKAKIK